jgi:hypothetical protein
MTPGSGRAPNAMPRMCRDRFAPPTPGSAVAADYFFPAAGPPPEPPAGAIVLTAMRVYQPKAA